MELYGEFQKAVKEDGFFMLIKMLYLAASENFEKVRKRMMQSISFH